MEVSETLILTFEMSISLKVDYFRSGLSDYVITRNQHIPLNELYRYFQRGMSTCSLTHKSSYSLLPIAVCRRIPANTELIAPFDSCMYLPLVAEEVWSHLLNNYPYDIVRIIIEKRPQIDTSLPLSLPISRPKELKALDLTYYFPQKLERSSLIELSQSIFHDNTRIKDSLRRGVWMHLLQVFPPNLTSHEERSAYIGKLRQIYSTLKGKIFSERESWSHEYIHLRESIQRDAVRTDPSEEFLNEETNIELLIDIIMIYILEHKSSVKYTQGMTDLLSPILYVMENEADAYICFAAMFERLKDNFTEWCEGALNRVERLRHLCEVLDPTLFNYLNREEMENPFILFFGMILIDCRREFNFNDCLHLLEVMWSIALPETTPTFVSKNKWASFMTTESVGVINETFGIINSAYSARPLSISETYPPVLTHPRDIPQTSSSSSNYNNNSDDIDDNEHVLSPHSSEGRDRSTSLPQISGYVIIPASDGIQVTKSEGHLPVNDYEEVRDSVSELESSSNKMSRRVHGLPPSNEMTDLSSLSSANTNGSNGLLCNKVTSTNKHDTTNYKGAEPTDEVPRSEDTLTDGNSDFITVIQTPPTSRHRTGSLRNSSPVQSSCGASVTSSFYLKHMSQPSMGSPYVSSLRPFDRFNMLHVSDSEQSTPLRRSRTSSRVSPLPEALPEEVECDRGIESISNNELLLSQLINNETSRPEISRSTSLSVNMTQSFSLFICLAILVTKKDVIMKTRVDFVGLSMLLNPDTGAKSNLDHILKVSRQLFNEYLYYQSISSNSTWIDNLPNFTMSTNTTPLDTPSSVRREVIRSGSTGTNTSINNY